MGERTSGKGYAADGLAGLKRADLGDDPPPAKVSHQQVEAAELEITAEDGPDPFCLSFIDCNLSTLGVIAEWTSEVTSRSNWANDSKTLRVSRPIEVVVLNCWVTETNDTLY